MSLSEVTWRATSTLRDAGDRWRFHRHMYPTIDEAVTNPTEPIERPFRLTDVQVPAAGEYARGLDHESLLRLVGRADTIAAHRLSFLNLVDVHLGDRIQWNRDWEHELETPRGFAPAIDYRDFGVTGDCKIVWEPNRHHHLVVLARAYRATGDVRYAAAVVEQIESWLDECPFGTGMNWRSGLELAIRSINWVWALDLILESGLFTGVFRNRVLHSLFLHLWEIDRKYSRGSSANNHLIGEAAGVFITSTYFPELSRAAEWHERSKAILCKQIHAQTFADGLNREHAFGYHCFVLQLCLYAGFVGRRAGRSFSSDYWARLETQFNALARMTEGGRAPTFGDADDGYVLDLGGSPGDVRPLLSIGGVLFDRTDWRSASVDREPVFWLFGDSSRTAASSLAGVDPGRLTSYAFADAGYYLLQAGDSSAEDQISVLFDCAELGFGTIAAHGHADALSFTLRAFGRDVLVDSGTYDYFTHPEWRAYFRGTRSHNTITVDHQDQSVSRGPFLWGTRANARCLRWSPDDNGGSVTAEHDGYARLSDPVTHRRTLSLDHGAGVVTVTDELEMQERHHLCLHFHFAEDCALEPVDLHKVIVHVAMRQLELQLDERLHVEIERGPEKPGPGWVSRGYHRKVPSASIVASALVSGRCSIVSQIRFGNGRESRR
jgi:heparinase II/III-like protein